VRNPSPASTASPLTETFIHASCLHARSAPVAEARPQRARRGADEVVRCRPARCTLSSMQSQKMLTKSLGPTHAPSPPLCACR
jgi:hypothetical protein